MTQQQVLNRPASLSDQTNPQSIELWGMHLSPSQLLYIFILFQIIIWTTSPLLDRHSLTHDTLEALTLGFQYQFGYSKHPFLSPWLSAFTSQLFQATDWPLYLLAQVVNAITLIFTWKLAREFLPPRHALLATLLLNGILFYNFYSLNLTPDSLQKPLWVGLAYFVYCAIKTQKKRYWCLAGVVASLAFLVKYQSVVLFFILFIFFIVNSEARLSFKKIGLYIGIGCFFLVISPHLIWNYHHHWISVDYAFSSPYETGQKSQLTFLKFIMNSVGNLSIIAFLMLPFYRHQKDRISLSRFQWQFLFAASLGPWLLTLLCCFIMEGYFPPRWLTPYFFSLGIFIIACLRPTISDKQYITFLALVFMTVLTLSLAPWIATKPQSRSDAYLPNKEIAEKINQLWEAHYHLPLPYIAGSPYLVSAIVPYLHPHPIPYLSWDKKLSPWLNQQDLAMRGGVFIWDIEGNYVWDYESAHCLSLPKFVVHQYPTLVLLGEFTFYRKTSNPAPILIGIALLPPQTSGPRQVIHSAA